MCQLYKGDITYRNWLTFNVLCVKKKRVTSFQVQSHIFHLITLSLCNIEKPLELVRQLASRTKAQMMNLSGVIRGEILL